MLDMITTAAFGAALGFASSTPLGVINLWVADATLARRRKTVAWFLVGVITCDVAFAAVAAWGYHTFLDNLRVTAWLELLGGSMIAIMGWRSRGCDTAQLSRDDTLDAQSHARAALLGASLCGTNPAFLMFWIIAVSAIDAELGVTIAGRNVPALMAGVVVGDVLWFLLLTRLVERGRDALGPAALVRIRRTIAWGFVAVGVYVAAQGVRSLSPF